MGSCLEQMGGPFDFCIGADLDAFLSVLQLLPVEVDVAKMEDRGLEKKNMVTILKSLCLVLWRNFYICT